MKRFALNTIILSGLALLTQLWSGCSRVEDGDGDRQTPNNNVPVRFSLNITETSPTIRKADDTTIEELVETIDVLAFVKSGADYSYSYRRRGTDYSEMAFSVDMISYSENQVVVILVNAREELNAANILVSDNIQGAMSKIFVTSGEEWATDADDYRAIPMAGISAPTVITEGMKRFPEEVGIIRMLARVNISLNANVGNFTLESAQIFNRVTKGYVGYKPSEWSSAAWVPTDGSGNPSKAYLPSKIYRAEGSGSESNITNSIYVLESKGVTLDRYLESTAIVVGGVYTSEAGPQTCYYRIDLTPNGQLGSSAIDIIRTHSYNIEIQKVSFPGAVSAKDAYEGVVTLSAEVAGWKPNKSGVIIDGQYYLKLSKSNYTLGAQGNAFDLNVKTNYNANPSTGYPAGITFETGGTAPWAGVTVVSGDTYEEGGETVYSYDLKIVIEDIPEESTDNDRWTSFTIKAGNMWHRMDIWQWNDTWLTSNAAASYAPSATNKYSITFTAAPMYPGQQWKIESLDDPDGILFEGANLAGLSGGDGGSIYFYVKSSARSGKTATLKVVDTKEDNPPLYVHINTP